MCEILFFASDRIVLSLKMCIAHHIKFTVKLNKKCSSMLENAMQKHQNDDLYPWDVWSNAVLRRTNCTKWIKICIWKRFEQSNSRKTPLNQKMNNGITYVLTRFTLYYPHLHASTHYTDGIGSLSDEAKKKHIHTSAEEIFVWPSIFEPRKIYTYIRLFEAPGDRMKTNDWGGSRAAATKNKGIKE